MNPDLHWYKVALIALSAAAIVLGLGLTYVWGLS